MDLRTEFENETGKIFTVAEMNGVEHANPEYVRWLEQRIEAVQVLEKNNTILAEAMAEIKATVDGNSDQSVKDIVYGCIEELKAT